jgi:hypothetical protein
MERLSAPSNRQQVRGFLTIHSTPSALRHHIDWAIQAVLGTWVKPTWTPQPLIPGSYRTQIEFRDREGAAAELASTLRSWHYLNFEVIENSNNGGELYRCTPELGIHRAIVDQTGAVILTENQLNAVLKNSFDEESIYQAISSLLGKPWELELDRFRSVDLQEVAHLRAI